MQLMPAEYQLKRMEAATERMSSSFLRLFCTRRYVPNNMSGSI